MSKVLLLIGTKKGGFILKGSKDRDSWDVSGPFCGSWPILDMAYDPASNAILAGGGSEWFGQAVWRTTDLGETWTHSSEGLTYDDETVMNRVWNLTPAHGAIYAGVEPAGLFRSDDGGVTWEHIRGLREHPSRPSWEPGAGGLCCHSVVAHPSDPDRVWVGISAVGAFATDDGGATWRLQNKNVRAGFFPEADMYPEFGQCVHSLHGSASPERLYQQNHCGAYRSDDSGENWIEITAGLPSQFGFASSSHPRDPETFYTIPLEDGEGRFMIGGKATIYRTRDAGKTWEGLRKGLPQDNAYVGVLRRAMDIDSLDPAGVYFGTSNGQLFASRDEGDSWTEIANYLPSIYSVSAAVIE